MSRERHEEMKQKQAGRSSRIQADSRGRGMTGRGRPRQSGSRAGPDRGVNGPAPRVQSAGEADERVAKRLARAGIASRREAEAMIASGRVAVNGHVLTTPAFNVRKTDVITVDGRPLPQTERTRLWLYHKPAGLLTTTRDPEGRPTVFASLPPGMPRVLSVGRLDINTEGLLLLTNDGGLSRLLELPATGWTRHYRVRAHGKISQEQLDGLKDGMAVDGIFYGAVQASIEREQGSNVWLSVTLREGKNREIKNILGALGLTVTRLIRVAFGPFQLGSLGEGMVQEIRGRTLRDQLGERLIAEANADFDAPVVKPFSNAPVASVPRGGGLPRKSAGGRGREWISSGSGGRRGPAGSDRDVRAAEQVSEVRRERRSRSANVWMAPGARPLRNKPSAPDRSGGRDDEQRRPASRPRNRRQGEPSVSASGQRPGGRGFATGRREKSASVSADGCGARMDARGTKERKSGQSAEGMRGRSHSRAAGKGANRHEHRRSRPPSGPRGGRNADRRR